VGVVFFLLFLYEFRDFHPMMGIPTQSMTLFSYVDI